MADHETILRRIRKLRALKESPNVHEAAVAAEKMQELIDTYKIEEALLIDEADEVPEEITRRKIYEFKGVRVTTWVLELAGAICRANGCKCYYLTGCKFRYGKERIRPGKISAAGTPSDLETATALLEWLVDEVERLYKEEKPEGFDRGEGKAWANSFRNGAVVTIRRRLLEAQERARKIAKNKAKLEALHSVADQEIILRLDTLAGTDEDPLEGHPLPDWATDILDEHFESKKNYALVKVNAAIVKVDHRLEEAQAWAKKNLDLGKGHRRTTGSDYNGFASGLAAGNRADLSGHKRKRIEG